MNDQGVRLTAQRSVMGFVRTGLLAVVLAGAALGAGCTLPPKTQMSAPVQEMSDARQAIQAAKTAATAKYAPESLREAERLMDQATASLAHGDYQGARWAAVSAREHAIAARHAAMSVQGIE